MSNQDDPEWEIVDSLPKKRRPSRQGRRIRIPKKFIIGAGIGLGILVLVPPARLLLYNFVRNFFAYWWFLVAAVGYWFIKRQLRRRR